MRFHKTLLLSAAVGVLIGAGTLIARTVTDTPLSPERLYAYGQFDPSVCNSKKIDKNWTHRYKIVMNYGYTDSKDFTHGGDLKIKKQSSDGENVFVVEQTYRDETKIKHTNKTKIHCTNEPIAKMKSWHSEIAFTSSSDPAINQSFTEDVTVAGDTLNVKIGKKTFTRPTKANITSDWLIFAGVQQLPKDDAVRTFDMLEACRNLRDNQKIIYKGKTLYDFGGKKIYLHRFEQTGNGILPYQYYLDENNVLVLVITSYRTYILQ